MKYPLYREDREAIRLPSGRPIEEFSLESLKAGRLRAEDLGIHEATLRRQAQIAEEARTQPDLLHEAPHTAPVKRLDEVKAARQLILRWEEAE